MRCAGRVAKQSPPPDGSSGVLHGLGVRPTKPGLFQMSFVTLHTAGLKAVVPFLDPVGEGFEVFLEE